LVSRIGRRPASGYSAGRPRNGCHQVTTLECGEYLDYTGVDLYFCMDGCPDEDYGWSTPVCYRAKYCHAQIHEDSLCHDCEGVQSCDEIIHLYGDQCGSVGACLIQIACYLVETCFQCENGDEVIWEDTKDNCCCI